MANEGRDIVLFLANGRLYIYLGDGIVVLEFPPEVVRDIDIKNKEALANLVITFIQANKITPAQIFFVLSESVCFSKDFKVADSLNTTRVDADVQSFIDSIPFNSVISKIYKTPTTYRVVGSNQDLIDVILDVFISKGFGLTALVPANIYHNFGHQDQLSMDSAKAILGDKEMAIAGSMVSTEVKNVEHEIAATKAQGKPINYRLFILIGVFVLGLVILGVVVLMRGGK
ncbi:MAG TPA: hypothetical protein VKC54_04105 [Patescibacteria group bacterium]|nr:hypothetical protein [Patescibacteria group bacterium]